MTVTQTNGMATASGARRSAPLTPARPSDAAAAVAATLERGQDMPGESETQPVTPYWGHQSFGVEIEVSGIAVRTGGEILAALFGRSTTDLFPTDHQGWGVRDDAGRTWKSVRDGSVSGCEIVTPICTYDDLSLVQEVVRKLRASGARTDGTTGIHIHVDASGHNGKSLRALVRLIRAREPSLFRALAVKPERQRFARPVDDELLRRINRVRRDRSSAERAWYGTRSERQIQSRESNHYDHSRYHGINLHAVWTHGTVEFRYFNSTLHAGELRAYVNFCLAVSHRALMTAGVSIKEPKAEWSDRTILNRLLYRIGFNGPEWKTVREHLTKRLPKKGRTVEQPQQPRLPTYGAPGSTISDHVDAVFGAARARENELASLRARLANATRRGDFVAISFYGQRIAAMGGAR